MLSNAHSDTLCHQVTVTTSARLHLGFFNLTDNPEGKFGGLGVAIYAPCTQIQIGKNKDFVVDAKNSECVNNIIENMIKSFNLPKTFFVQVLQNIPEHTGLGSGTQMALSVGAALNQLFGLNLTVAQIARAA